MSSRHKVLNHIIPLIIVILNLSLVKCFSISPNPVALGTRWLAYAERKMLPSKRSSGGCDCDGVSSYTATVLHAAKSLGKGLRELGEQMAAGFGGANAAANNSGGTTSSGTPVDELQSGILTIMDIKVIF